jgi:hypothetical protein
MAMKGNPFVRIKRGKTHIKRIPNTHTGTSIQSGSVKLVLWTQNIVKNVLPFNYNTRKKIHE